MKKLLFIIFFVSFFGCNNPINKSIFEPLEMEELKKINAKDSTFLDIYRYVQAVNDSLLKKDIDKVKWADLTYRRLQNYVEFTNDTAYFKPIREKLFDEWEEKYGPYHTKVDSISNYWKKYREENSLEQYVKIELEAIDKDYYTYSREIRNVNLGFRLTPLKGTIEQLRFGYRIVAKIDEKEENIDDDYLYYSSVLDNSWCMTTTPFSVPVVRYWETNLTNERLLKNLNLQEFQRDYNIHIEVDMIRKDGNNMSMDDLNIPESVQNHWKYENKEYLEDLYIDEIVEEILGEEYIPEYQYIWNGIEKILKEKDSLSFEFFQLMEFDPEAE